MHDAGSVGAQMNVGPVTSPASSGNTQAPGSATSSRLEDERLLLLEDEAPSPSSSEWARDRFFLVFLSPLNDSFMLLPWMTMLVSVSPPSSKQARARTLSMAVVVGLLLTTQAAPRRRLGRCHSTSTR